MTQYIAYSYFYTVNSPMPSWYREIMKDYFEWKTPEYFRRYLNANVVIYPARYAIISRALPENDLLDYFLGINKQINAGNDSVIMMTDIPNIDELCPPCIGENFYREQPNVAWASVMNWEQVDQIAHGNIRLRKQIAIRGVDGVRGFVTAQHEITHYVLLNEGGEELSRKIDGGILSGLVYMNDELIPDVRGEYAFQRVRPDMPYHSRMGAYHI